jgi:uncharacterized protein YjiS (DUF1127 family)
MGRTRIENKQIGRRILMTNDSHFGRYHYAAGSVPFSVCVGGFKLVGDAVRKAASAVASGIADKAWAFETNRRKRRPTRVSGHLSDRALKDIGIRRSEIQFLSRKVADNPGTDYRVFSQ